MTFLFCLLLAYVVLRGCEDITAAVRKQPPPRQEIRTAKLHARAGRGDSVPQSSAGRYFTGLLDDAWDSAHHRRQLMADHRADKRAHRAHRKIERSRQRQQRKDGKRAATSHGEPLAPTTESGHTPASEPDQPDPAGFDAQAPAPISLDPQAADPLPHRERSEAERDARTDSGEAPESAESPDAATGDEPYSPGDTHPDSKEDTPPRSNVIALPHPRSTSTPQRMELPTMTSPATGEVTGLNSAIAYAEQLSAYCTHTGDQVGSVLPSGQDATTSCEQARASLAEGGVTGESLSHVSSVQNEMTAAVEALNQALAQLEAAGASAEALTARLQSHLSVQEAYSANPDAGNKEFVTAD